MIHIIARRLIDLSPRLAQLQAPPARVPGTPALVAPYARADEVKRPPRDLREEAARSKRLYRSRDFH